MHSLVKVRLLLILLTIASAQAEQVTWSSQIGGLIYKHCSGCHRPGQPAPFSLLTYEDATRHAATIATAVRSRYMPPWKPQPQWGTFEGARRLTTTEIDTISRWIRAGTPPGNLARAPTPPQLDEDWQLGRPDMSLKLSQAWKVPAQGQDVYRCLVLPETFPETKYVRAFEFRPGLVQSIHHALFFVDAGIQGPPSSSYDCFGTPGFLPTAGLGGWTPGSRAVAMPEGTSVRIPAGSRLVMQLHAHPIGKPEAIEPVLGLYFDNHPPRRILMDVALGSRRIDIPPGEESYTVRDHFELPVDVQVTGIIPHAHYICRDMKAWAELPDGTRRRLLWINDWDFNWQDQFRYKTPFTLPSGTRIEMLFTYDNSVNNIRNPNQPPRRVTWGPGTTDEMAGIHVQVIPRHEEDAHELGMALWGKIMREVGGGFYKPR